MQGASSAVSEQVEVKSGQRFSQIVAAAGRSLLTPRPENMRPSMFYTLVPGKRVGARM